MELMIEKMLGFAMVHVRISAFFLVASAAFSNRLSTVLFRAKSSMKILLLLLFLPTFDRKLIFFPSNLGKVSTGCLTDLTKFAKASDLL